MSESKVVFNSKLERFELHHTVNVQPWEDLNAPTWALGHTWTVGEFNRYLKTIKGAVESHLQHEAIGYDGCCCLCGTIIGEGWATGSIGSGDDIKSVCIPCTYTDKFKELQALHTHKLG